MRAFVVFCMFAVATAQYDYTPGTSPPEAILNAGQEDGLIGSGATQLSEPIQQLNEFNKEFLSYTAPEHEFDDAHGNEKIANIMKRNLRVLFIRGPENNGLENAALKLANSALDDRTAIYVLHKQADISDLANRLNQIKHSTNHKPEVHFVKYRTQADADNAQRTIQSQYDSLPGSSSNHNAGSAPVLDFASKSGQAANAAPVSAFIQPPKGEYLPSSRRY